MLATLTLGVSWLVAGADSVVRADDGGAPGGLAPTAAAVSDHAPPALEGTAEEEREYARREAMSPEVQEFVGGDGVVVAVLVIGVLVLVYLILDKEDKI